MAELRPGQVEPNGLELAILARIARDEDSRALELGAMHVLSREYTGVGCFTKCPCDEAAGPREHVGLGAVIRVPGVAHGLGAVLFLRGACPDELEVYTFGGERWDGVHDEFSIEDG
jgi:hypothetical protein